MRAFTRPQNYSALINTLQLALGTGVMSVVIGVPLAWATARTDIKFRNAVHALVALSYITPPYLTALAYIILLGPDAGQFNRFLRMFVEVNSGPINIFTMGGIIFVIGIHVFAFTYFLTYSALRAVDSSLEESAQILGARRWQTTLRVNLPLVAPAITGGALLAAINSLALFGPQAIIGTPAQIVFLPTRIYATIGSYPPRWAEASALSLVLVLLTVIGLAVQRSYLERRSYVTVGGRGAANEPNFAWRLALAAFAVLHSGCVFQRCGAHRGACVDCVLQELDGSSVAVELHARAFRHGTRSLIRYQCAASSTALSSRRQLQRSRSSSAHPWPISIFARPSADVACSIISPSCLWACRAR